jgi:hypothetical protein
VHFRSALAISIVVSLLLIVFGFSVYVLFLQSAKYARDNEIEFAKVFNFVVNNTVMVETQTVPKTAIEIFEMLPEGTWCEVIDNVLYMLPSSTERHEWLRGEIFAEIHNHVKKNKLGKAYSPSPDVYLKDQLSALFLTSL